MKKFSLMELLVVMGLLLLMMTLLLPTVGPMMNRARISKTTSIIMGQLEVGYLQSFTKKQVVRVSFEYDPIGKNITKQEISKITGMATVTDNDEFLARQSKGFDLNGDGVPGGFCNRQTYWMKVYLCRDDFLNNSSTVANIRSDAELIGEIDCLGPFWLRRPFSRTKDFSGNFIPVKMYMKSILDENGKKFYYRPVLNANLDTGGADEVLQKVIAADSYSCVLIDDMPGAKINRTLSVLDIKALPSVGSIFTVQQNSVATFKEKGGSRAGFLYGNAVDAYFLSKPEEKDQIYQISTDWYDWFEGDMVDPNALDYGTNDDEDKLIDEGMSVSVETFHQPGTVFDVLIDPSKDVFYSNYFANLEDNSLKVNREYFTGGVDKKGVMLRRVWGVKPNKVDKVLLWRNDAVTEIVKPEFQLDGKNWFSTPAYFSIVFDKKNGSGVYFCNSFVSVQVGKLFFQICDDDNKLTTMIEFSDGVAKEGTLSDFGLNTSLVDYYQGVSK